jgi:adenylate cyclase
VLAGEFQRGSGTAIRAAIWTCDLRGFTTLSDRRPPTEVTVILDAYFECVVAPIQAARGEVLKFIGDAVLAIFPVADDDPADACARALQAGREVLLGLARLNEERGLELAIGVGLHLGDVFYGNVGGTQRLDFTVIGAAVNEVCRIESLCKVLGTPLIMSAVFRAQVEGGDIIDLGEHTLHGVVTPARLFGLARASSR